MNSKKKTARIVGVLFITAAVAGILNAVLLGFLDDPDYLVNVSADENQVIIGAILDLILAVAVLPDQ